MTFKEKAKIFLKYFSLLTVITQVMIPIMLYILVVGPMNFRVWLGMSMAFEIMTLMFSFMITSTLIRDKKFKKESTEGMEHKKSVTMTLTLKSDSISDCVEQGQKICDNLLKSEDITGYVIYGASSIRVTKEVAGWACGRLWQLGLLEIEKDK